MQQEYIYDAQAALSLLQADSRIGDIYLLGHSQGGMILPRVMQALGAEHFAGGIILEGSPLPLWEIQYHQNLALVPKMEEMYRDAAVILIEQEAAKAETLADMTDDELKAETLFGTRALIIRKTRWQSTRRKPQTRWKSPYSSPRAARTGR